MTLEKWIERFHSYDDGGVIFDFDKRVELLFFLEELKEKRLNRTGGMTRAENNAWYLLCGVLMGMVLAFWFYPDIEFFRGQCLVMLVVLIAWTILRRERRND